MGNYRKIIICALAVSIMSPAVVLAPSAAVAQTVGIKDGVGKDYFSVRDDMKSYEVIYKEHSKEYADYYRSVRERIVQRLKCNYRHRYRKGDVDLSFVLNSNGSLARIDVDTGLSTKDKRLVDVAVLSLQEASPFQPFPKELDAGQLPFSLLISFKEEA